MHKAWWQWDYSYIIAYKKKLYTREDNSSIYGIRNSLTIRIWYVVNSGSKISTLAIVDKCVYILIAIKLSEITCLIIIIGYYNTRRYQNVEERPTIKKYSWCSLFIIVCLIFADIFNLSLLPFAFYSRLLPELQNRFKSVYNPPNLLNFTFDKKTILDFKIMR